ncbi:MAG TPA: hypothetical protein VGM94_01540 [Galbitalea sp.]|jgi:hypothetical protein
MTIQIVHRSPDDYFYLNFPAAPGDVYASSDRIVVTSWLLEGIRLAELRSVALRLRHRYDQYGGSAQWATDDEGATFDVFDGEPAEYWDLDDDVPLALDAEILAGQRGVRVRVVAITQPTVEQERVALLANTGAARMRGRIRGIERLWDNSTRVGWAIEAELRRRDALVTDLLRFGLTIGETVGELSGSIAPDAAINVIEAGYPEALIGLAENEWLEAKSQPWNLDADYGKIELAQDVASLANAAGGLIVLGARTRKVDGEEAIYTVDGIASERFSPYRVRSVIDARVYPPVAGLHVRRAAIAGSSHVIGYVSVPRQDPASYPFLVHGAIVGARVEGSFLSIVRRRGDQTLSTRFEEVHHWLRAGRRLLSEGRLDPPLADPANPIGSSVGPR